MKLTKKVIILILMFPALVFSATTDVSTDLINAYNANRLAGKLVWESRTAGDYSKAGLFAANLNRDGTLDMDTKVTISEITDSAEVNYEYDRSAILGNQIYYLVNDTVNKKISLRKYILEDGKDKSGNVNIKPVLEHIYDLGDYDDTKAITGILAIRTSTGTKIVEAVKRLTNDGQKEINTHFLKVYNIDYDDDVKEIYDYDLDDILPTNNSTEQNNFKIRAIPSSNNIAVFTGSVSETQTPQGISSTLYGYLYKLDDNGEIEKASSENSITLNIDDNIAVESAAWDDILQITDIQFVYDQQGHPGLAVITHSVGSRGIENYGNSSHIFFFELAQSSDSSSDMLWKSDGDASEITTLLIPNFENEKSLIRIAYPYSVPTDDSGDIYESHIKTLTGLWYNYGGYYSDYDMSTDTLDKGNKYEIVKDSSGGFSPLSFVPYGIVFGVPPRYDDGTAISESSTFTFKGDEGSGKVGSTSHYTSSIKSSKLSAFNISIGVASQSSQESVEKNTISSDLSTEDIYSGGSYGANSAWIIGGDLPYLQKNEALAYISKSAQGNHPYLQIYNVADKKYINYQNLDFKLAVDNEPQIDVTSITFDIENPENILANIEDKSSWSELTKGLPTFNKSTDVEDYLNNTLADNWDNAATEKGCMNYEAMESVSCFNVVKIKIPTNSQGSSTYQLNITDDSTITNKKMITTTLSSLVEDKIETSWEISVENIFSKSTSWVFDYTQIDYNKLKDKDEFYVDAYLFLPSEYAQAKDLPWSSDYMKKNNMVTWAIAYSVTKGI